MQCRCLLDCPIASHSRTVQKIVCCEMAKQLYNSRKVLHGSGVLQLYLKITISGALIFWFKCQTKSTARNIESCLEVMKIHIDNCVWFLNCKPITFLFPNQSEAVGWSSLYINNLLIVSVPQIHNVLNKSFIKACKCMQWIKHLLSLFWNIFNEYSQNSIHWWKRAAVVKTHFSWTQKWEYLILMVLQRGALRELCWLHRDDMKSWNIKRTVLQMFPPSGMFSDLLPVSLHLLQQWETFINLLFMQSHLGDQSALPTSDGFTHEHTNCCWPASMWIFTVQQWTHWAS